MSASFLLLYRNHPIRLTFQAGKTVAEVSDQASATPFLSEADAWLAAAQHHLNPDHCAVVAASQYQEAV